MKQTILMLFLLTAIVTVLVACGGTGTPTDVPTETWRIEFFDPSGESVGVTVIQLTTRRVRSCGGVFAVIEVKMSDTYPPYHSIGREACANISDTNFAADLNIGYKDNNTLVKGTRSGDQASGRVTMTRGPEGYEAGTFKAYRVNP